jgi:hypothetical protein
MANETAQHLPRNSCDRIWSIPWPAAGDENYTNGLLAVAITIVMGVS